MGSGEDLPELNSEMWRFQQSTHMHDLLKHVDLVRHKSVAHMSSESFLRHLPGLDPGDRVEKHDSFQPRPAHDIEKERTATELDPRP